MNFATAPLPRLYVARVAPSDRSGHPEPLTGRTWQPVA